MKNMDESYSKDQSRIMILKAKLCDFEAFEIMGKIVQ